jgi:hypothetical protein
MGDRVIGDRVIDDRVIDDRRSSIADGTILIAP